MYSKDVIRDTEKNKKLKTIYLVFALIFTLEISWIIFHLIRLRKRQLLSAPTQNNKPFVAIWNVPSQNCSKEYGIDLELPSFDIIANKDETFIGEEVTIFYQIGLYPHYTADGTAINGGLPQLGNISAHIDQVKADINYYIPNTSFSGLAVIDWESWRPVFKRNGYNSVQKINIRKSELLIFQEHPEWSKKNITDEAARQFETAARLFMSTTLNIGRQMRPAGHWGFYGFPDCYNHKKGRTTCTNNARQLNNQLSWLFGQSSVLAPSIYLKSQPWSLEEGYARVHGTLEEVLRVKKLYSEDTTPILPYTMYRYDIGGDMFSVGDLNNTIRQSLDAGMSGVILWGSSHDFKEQSDCLQLKSYIHTTLGPFVKEVTSFARTCSAQLCNYRGQCVRRTWNTSDHVSLTLIDKIGGIFAAILSYVLNDDVRELNKHIGDFTDYKCKCFPNWNGSYCDQ